MTSPARIVLLASVATLGCGSDETLGEISQPVVHEVPPEEDAPALPSNAPDPVPARPPVPRPPALPAHMVAPAGFRATQIVAGSIPTAKRTVVVGRPVGPRNSAELPATLSDTALAARSRVSRTRIVVEHTYCGPTSPGAVEDVFAPGAGEGQKLDADSEIGLRQNQSYILILERSGDEFALTDYSLFGTVASDGTINIQGSAITEEEVEELCL